jgi:hypothetical protein
MKLFRLNMVPTYGYHASSFDYYAFWKNHQQDYRFVMEFPDVRPSFGFKQADPLNAHKNDILQMGQELFIRRDDYWAYVLQPDTIIEYQGCYGIAKGQTVGLSCRFQFLDEVKRVDDRDIRIVDINDLPEDARTEIVLMMLKNS